MVRVGRGCGVVGIDEGLIRFLCFLGLWVVLVGFVQRGPGKGQPGR